MNTISPTRRSSVISNCTNDSDVASDKTSISGQPKKLRKQINNAEFKQNYFELSLNNTGVQVLAFQPGNESTPKKRKRSSSSANSRRKSVSCAPSIEEDSNEESSPNIQTKQTNIKKRKQSVTSVETPSDEMLFPLQAIDQSLLETISSEQELFDSLFLKGKMEDETPTIKTRKESTIAESLFLPTSAFKESKLKGRNAACSTTNIQTTSTCSYNLKKSPETPNSIANPPRNRSVSNSHPIILNQTNTNTIRKRSNSCVSTGQLSHCNSTNVHSNTTNQPTNQISINSLASNTSINACTYSPPERLMAKEMKLNFYLNLKREVENCGNSQHSPMNSCSSSGTSLQAMTTDSINSATVVDQYQPFDSVGAFQLRSNVNYCTNDTNYGVAPWEGMDLTVNNQDIAINEYNHTLVNSSMFSQHGSYCLSNSGLETNLFDALYQTLQESLAKNTQQAQSYNHSCNEPEISLEFLQSMEPHEIQNLINYLVRLNESKKATVSPQHAAFQDSQAANPQLSTSSEIFLLNPDNLIEFHSNSDEFMF